MVKVAAYCRVSTDSSDQLNSLANQTSYFEDHCRNFDIDLYRVYADEGITGTSWQKRDEFQRMLYDSGLDIDLFKRELRLSNSDRAPKFTRILVKDISRFARNVGNASDIFERLRQKGVYVDFITAGLSTEDIASDVLIKIMAVLAEAESKDKSTKILFGQKRGAEQGVIKTSVIYGYRYDKESNTLEVIPEEADMIRQIYEWYVGGLGFRRILQALEERGIHARSGKPFAQQTVKRIVSNPAYKGVLVRNKWKSPPVFSGQASAKLRPESEWSVHENRIPRIVDDELWDRAQKVRSSKVNHVNKRGVKTAIGEYAGKIVCGVCGNNYIRNIEPRNSRIYFLCSLKKRKGVKECKSPNVSLVDVNAAIEKIKARDLSDIFIEDRQNVVKTIETVIKKPLVSRLDEQSDVAAASIRERLQQLNEQKRRVADLYVSGNFDIDYLNGKTAEIDEQIEVAKTELTQATMTNDEIRQEITKVDEVINAIKRIGYESVAGYDANVLELISSIMVGSLNGNSPQVFLSINFSFSGVFSKVDIDTDNETIPKILRLLSNGVGRMVKLSS